LTPVAHRLTPLALGGAGVLLTPLLALAEESVAGGSGVSPGHVLSVLLGLFAVLITIGLLAWGSRHLFRLQPAGHGPIRILGSLALGARERVVLLEVGAAQVVVGVSPGRLQTLHVLASAERVAPPAEPSREGFAEHLSRLTGRGGQSARDR